MKNVKESLNTIGEDGFSPVHRAVQSGCVEAVQFVLENGGDASLLTKSGDSVLHIAAFQRDASILQLLLATTARRHINRTDKLCEMTPLHIAIYRGIPLIVDELLHVGGDPSIPDRDNNDSYRLAQFWSEQASSGLSVPGSNQEQVVQLLMNKYRSLHNNHQHNL